VRRAGVSEKGGGEREGKCFDSFFMALRQSLTKFTCVIKYNDQRHLLSVLCSLNSCAILNIHKQPNIHLLLILSPYILLST